MTDLLSLYPLPTDVPSGEIDPQELERAKALAMIRAGLGVANREPLQSAFGGGLKAYLGAQANSRQQMLAQLQAYKTRQEIAKAAYAAQKEQQITDETGKAMSGVGISGQGGPTPANATLAMIEQFRNAAVVRYRYGDTEGAKRLMDSAKDLVEKYSTTPQMVNVGGQLKMAQLSEQGNLKVQDVLPYEKQHFADTGGAIVPLGEYTATPGTAVPKTQTFGERTAAANQNLAERRFAFDQDQAAAGTPGTYEGGIYRVPKVGPATPVVTATGEPLKPPIAAQTKEQIAQNNVNIRLAAEAINLVQKNKTAFGPGNLVGDFITQRTDPKGVPARAAVANLSSLKFHDRSGANITASESPRLTPFIPAVTDEAPAIITKLQGFQRESILMNQELLSGKSITDVAGLANTVPPDVQKMIDDAKKAKGG